MKKVKIDQSAVMKAWEHWLLFHYNIDSDEVTDRFFKYLECPTDTHIDPWNDDDDFDSIDVTVEEANKISMAVQPYWRAIFSAWYVRSGLLKAS